MSEINMFNPIFKENAHGRNMQGDAHVEQNQNSFLRAKPWVPGGDKSMFTVIIH